MSTLLDSFAESTWVNLQPSWLNLTFNWIDSVDTQLSTLPPDQLASTFSVDQFSTTFGSNWFDSIIDQDQISL